MVFNIISNNILRKQEYPEKTTNLSQVTDKLQVHLAWAGFELTTLVVTGTDRIGSCKSNYHMITSTTDKKNPIFQFIQMYTLIALYQNMINSYTL
jgi:hypothetical protein